MRNSALILSLAASVLAHSHVDEIWAPNPSVHYQGWNPNDYDTVPYPNDTPGWYTENQGGNPLYPVAANQYNIICAKNSSPANISAPIAPGETVRVRWWNPGQWPPSHKGPVIDYIAPCNGPCSSVDPTTLRFVKIAELGWIDNSRTEGYWAADALIDDNSSWNIKVPDGLKAGEYVLRTEIIALHVAHLANPGPYSTYGAEFYPNCINLQVTGDGTKEITGGVDARTLYDGTEPGIDYKTLHETNEHGGYVIPGPAIWSGAAKRATFRA
ncbi:glycoside hydrolase [Pyrenochaeta sp. DS3sAY3a]|nr:glycoside hydrolase [Pyrenochaeta sp. DS3sAY3a]